MRGLIRRAGVLAGAAAVLVGSGTGIAAAQQAPRLMITPNPGNFGTVPVGGTSTRTFTLANTGGSASGNLTVTVSSGPPYAITGTTCRGSLPPRQTCTVTVRFAPANKVTATATLTAAGQRPEARATATLDGATHPPTPVTINLVNINDFHGTIDQATVKWAGTVERARTLDGATPATTLFLSAGDNVGASTFASSIAQDQPTIDVLNELGLQASAVGNHEMDKGFDDLRGRIQDAANWSYVADNVFYKGTTTPALPQDAMFSVGGLSVAVIGAVTEEAPRLVSPAGIADIDIGPVVQNLNRVANELATSARPPDVIVAEVHAGATRGAGSTLEQQVQIPGEFQDMVKHLSPRVDAIFNGHTHQVYAWQAPNPGAPAGWIKQRPILQTASAGANVGDVQLKIDPITHALLSYTEQNIPRTDENAGVLISQFPVLKQVQTSVDNALAHAAKAGDQPVGSITADITTAAKDPSQPFTATSNRDGRDQESTLGGLVANALRDGIPSGDDELARPDLGIVNPGGLRAELLFAGNTSTNPANKDGVVTFAEANSVLPFVSGISEVRLTGSTLKHILEEQWQPVGSSRPFLSLGLSSNVHVIYNPAAPAGSHITSVTIDGQPLGPSKTYVVSTFDFLASGGDNFSAFTKGKAMDTGLVDRDLWINYLNDHPDLSPDFARAQVAVTGLPSVVQAGDHLSLTLSNLNLTSSGSPANSTMDITATPAGGNPIRLPSVPVSEGMVGAVPGSVVPSTGGVAKASLTVPAALDKGGALTFVAQPTGTTATVKVAETATASRAPLSSGLGWPRPRRTTGTSRWAGW